jgi:MraZ protein
VVAYPLREWTAFEEKLMGMSQFDRALRNLRRIYFSSAVECDVDSVGRLLIPQTLRNHGDLKREVLWSGMGTHLELWDKDRYAAMREHILNDEPTREAMERRLAELGL